jgi:hypothetical protein
MADEPAYTEQLHAVLGHGRFGHAQHVELAWRFLRTAQAQEAEEMMCAALLDVAGLHGTPDKYNETLTRAWVRIVHLHGTGGGEEFEEFAARCPGLFDRQLAERHYSPEVLWSEEVRRHWHEPDRQPFP